MVTPRPFLAGTPSAILDMAGAGTRQSVTTRDLFGVVRAKDTFGALTRLMAGIPVRLMECWRSGIDGGPTSGDIVGHDTGEPRSVHANSMFTNELFFVSFDGLAWKNQPHFALC
jgi:hypothetical protein